MYLNTFIFIYIHYLKINSLFPYTLGWEKTCTCHIYFFAKSYSTCQITAHNTYSSIYLRKNGSKALLTPKPKQLSWWTVLPQDSKHSSLICSSWTDSPTIQRGRNYIILTRLPMGNLDKHLNIRPCWHLSFCGLHCAVNYCSIMVLFSYIYYTEICKWFACNHH